MVANYLKTAEKLAEKGVKFIDIANVYIDETVEVGEGTTIYPNVFLKGTTKIGKNAVIGLCSEIENSTVCDGVSIKHSVILNSYVGENSSVGPFAYIRPDCRVGKNVKIGDFVEIKNSTIDDGTKLSHLTYAGDADVGKNVNFGCGTVIVNYDGTHKHRTKIENNAFIGCNTNLVSPIKIGEGAYTAAGSTITEDVPKNTLAIARNRQTIKENWKRK